MWKMAQKFHAVVVFAEHRYYGESLTFGKSANYSDSANLGYLNSQQALADYAYLISYLKSQTDMENSSVIAFGGSYGGLLSAWMRMKYPHLIVGFVSVVKIIGTNCIFNFKKFM